MVKCEVNLIDGSILEYHELKLPVGQDSADQLSEIVETSRSTGHASNSTRRLSTGDDGALDHAQQAAKQAVVRVKDAATDAAKQAAAAAKDQVKDAADAAAMQLVGVHGRIDLRTLISVRIDVDIERQASDIEDKDGASAEHEQAHTLTLTSVATKWEFQSSDKELLEKWQYKLENCMTDQVVTSTSTIHRLLVERDINHMIKEFVESTQNADDRLVKEEVGVDVNATCR